MLTAFLIIILLLFLLLFIQVGGEILYEESKHRIRLVYAGIRIPVDSKSHKEKKKAPKKEKPLNVPESIEQFQAVHETFFRLWELYGGKPFSRLFHVLKRFRRTLHFHVHRLSLTIASSDPALTGILYGAACSASATLPRSVPLILIPDFVGNKSDLQFRISMTIVPAQVLFEIIRTTIYLRLWKVWQIKREIWSPIQARRQHV